MEKGQNKIFIRTFLVRMKKNRLLSLSFIIVILISSITIIALFSYLFSPYHLPELELNSFRIVEVEEEAIYADLTLGFAEPITQNIQIQRIACKLYYSNNSNDIILAEGKTVEPFEILENKDHVNISFIFESSSIGRLLQAFLSDENLGLKGRIYLENGLSVPFNYYPQKVKISMFPTIKILDVHPITPGTTLEIFTEIINPHEITLNITTGNFTLYSPEIGSLGNVMFDDIKVPPKNSTITFHLFSDESSLKWIFQQALNNGTIEAEIQDFFAIINFVSKDIEITMEKGVSFLWEKFSPGIQIVDLMNVAIEDGAIAFDVRIGILGEPLWGYNITPCSGINWSVSFNFYHPLLENEIVQIGKSVSNVSVKVKKFEFSIITLHINVFPVVATEMILYWGINREIDINIRDGSICLQFYEIEMQILFEYQFNGSNLK